jgi:DNA-directed RNA polymerase
MTLLNRQIEMELAATNEGMLRGIQQMQEAFQQGRADDTGVGKRLLLRAFEDGLPLVQQMLETRTAGPGGKYRAMLRRVRPEILCILGIRHIIAACARPDVMLMQDVLRDIGRAIETESVIDKIIDINPYYVEKVEAQVKKEASRSISHIQRKYRTGAKDIGLDIDPWTSDEKIGTARLLLICLFELGLFEWFDLPSGRGDPYKAIKASEALEKHLSKAVEAANAIIRFPAMLVEPRPWTNHYQGGYITDELAVHSPMMTIRGMSKKQRNWVINNLSEGCARAAKDAANKAQSVPYRINKEVQRVAAQALANPRGILGLPPHGSAPQPAFPFDDDWIRKKATPKELEIFQEWKDQMKDWYTTEKHRNGKKIGLIQKLNETKKYLNEERIYFPCFFDWRGRLYFRSALNPQSHDMVKGILEFAEGKALGARGLFWLKVHVANCCGYDKKDFHLRAKWTEENWGFIRDFINDPLNVEPPEEDTAFTLLAAGLALQEALEMEYPEDYICHVPCAQDATCSGLQHFSAMFRDPIGAKYTNLIDSETDEKADIYTATSALAAPLIQDFCEGDTVLQQFWQLRPIPRSMAKRPVMTYVYGSTLMSTLQYVTDDLMKSGADKIPDYTYHKMSVPVAKALRHAVEDIVPAAAEGMKYLQALTRRNPDPMRWFSPVGIPVLNWSEIHEVKQMAIRSMGVVAITMRKRTGEYDKQTAANGISPNFVHSLDSAHLCMTINHFAGQIVPIHDSFGTHMCDVDSLHISLRSTFANMYQEDVTQRLLEFFPEGVPVPERPLDGNLDVTVVLKSRFMFC